jgi:translation initiation factor IF-1
MWRESVELVVELVNRCDFVVVIHYCENLVTVAGHISGTQRKENIEPLPRNG